jgi:hypothetical protein
MSLILLENGGSGGGSFSVFRFPEWELGPTISQGKDLAVGDRGMLRGVLMLVSELGKPSQKAVTFVGDRIVFPFKHPSSLSSSTSSST